MYNIDKFLKVSVEVMAYGCSVLIHMEQLTLLLMLVMPCYYSMNTLESNPAAVNGTLTTCSGNQIEITCNHNEIDTASTIWRISPPINCLTTITHGRNPDAPPCGSIIFQNITVATRGTTLLSSTAVVSANVTMSDSIVECSGGNNAISVEVGNISLCVIGQLPPPANIQCINDPDLLLITWDAVTDRSCAESPIKYNVTVVRQSDGMVIDSLPDVDNSETKIINMTTPDVDYNVSISARTTIVSCNGQQATIICKRSAASNHSSTVLAMIVLSSIITMAHIKIIL